MTRLATIPFPGGAGPAAPGTTIEDRDSFGDATLCVLFVSHHLALFPKCGLPDALSAEGDKMYVAWCEYLRTRNVSVSDAMEASRRLQARPPDWPREHLPAIYAMSQVVARERSLSAAEIAARHAREAQAESDRLREEAALQAAWDRATPEDRRAVEADVLRRWPWSKERPGVFRAACLSRYSGELSAGRATPTTDPDVIDASSFA